MELLEEKLKQLNQDELMLKAIRSVFDNVISDSLPVREEGDPNIVLGEKYRAFTVAVDMIEDAFVEIDGYREDGVQQDKYNKGK